MCAPALAFFKGLAPPLFPQLCALLSPLCAALLVAVYKFVPRKDKSTWFSVMSALGFIVAAICALSLYVVMLESCSVTDPQGGRARFQIGFAMAEWGLTPLGHSLKSAHPLWTAREMLMAVSFQEGSAELIWQPWTIRGVGALLIAIHIAAFTVGHRICHLGPADHQRAGDRQNGMIVGDLFENAELRKRYYRRSHRIRSEKPEKHTSGCYVCNLAFLLQPMSAIVLARL